MTKVNDEQIEKTPNFTYFGNHAEAYSAHSFVETEKVNQEAEDLEFEGSFLDEIADLCG